MIRRRTILTALGCLTGVAFALGPVSRWWVQSWLRESYGSEVHIGSVSIHPLRGEIDLQDVRVDVDCQDGSQLKLVDATLKVSSVQALSRKFLVQSARLEGIQIPELKPNPSLVPTFGWASQRTDSSELIPTEFTRVAVSEVEVWNSFQDQMRMKATASNISQQWHQRFMELDLAEQDIRRGVEALKSKEKLFENPLRNIPALRASIQQANDLRSQIENTQAELIGVSKRLHQDRLQLNDMRHTDLQELVQCVPQTLADSDRVTDSIFKARAAIFLQELERYATLAMSAVQEPLKLASSVRANGKDFHFPELESSPNLWMQRTSIRGEATIGGEWHAIDGLLVDLTDSPELIPRPITGSWKATANQRDVEINTRRSFSIHRPIDEISVKAFQLGSGFWELACIRDVRLTCQGSPPQAIANWEIDANQWRCNVLITQTDTDFKMAQTTPDRNDRIALEIDRALEKITHFELSVRISATKQDEPRLTWESNLAEPMRQGLASGLKIETESQVETLRNLYQQAFEQNWSDLNAIVKARSSSLSRRLEQLNKDLERYSTDVRSRLDHRETRLASQPNSEDNLDR